MSYQTVTDIIIGSQNDLNFKAKDVIQENTQSSSTSFSELVSFYKNDSVKTEDNKPVDNTKKEETSLKDKTTESKVENKEEVVEDSKCEEEVSKVTKKESTKETKEEFKVSKEEKVDKKAVLINKDEKLTIENEKLPNVKDEKEVKDNSKKNRKLADKDFSRLNEVSGKNENIQVEENLDNVKHNKKISKKDSNKEENIEVKNNFNNEAINLSNVASSDETNNSNLQKDSSKDESLFNTKETKKDGKTYLDKEGKIEVQDLRTNEGKVQDMMNEKEPKMKVSEPKLVNENTANITMELNQDVNSNVLSSNTQTAASTGSNFQAMLNNQIQQSAPEFVKAGNLILKDNSQGTINLVLRPDNLGNVKLHLSLDGKNITGHITVATKEALEVFKDNAETLREAFIKNGFNDASFDVSFGGNGSSNNQQMAFEGQNDGTNLLAKRVYNGNGGEGEATSTNVSSEKNNINSNYSINIVA